MGACSELHEVACLAMTHGLHALIRFLPACLPACLGRCGAQVLELLPYNFTECCGPSERYYATLFRINRDTIHYWSLRWAAGRTAPGSAPGPAHCAPARAPLAGGTTLPCLGLAQVNAQMNKQEWWLGFFGA